MNSESTWERYRQWLCDSPELGFRLDLSRMDLPDGYLDTMGPQIEAAYDAMKNHITFVIDFFSHRQ